MKYIMGPFEKLSRPILSPNPESIFNCPILNRPVRWEEQNVYNPAAVVRDGKVFILYRADDTPKPEGWGRTCRIGLAYSNDGHNFTRLPEPVLYPDNDFMKEYEWEGGTEVHIIEDENGIYYMNYTAWNGTSDALCIATSTNLIHWKKHGTAFGDVYDGIYVKGLRSGVVVSRFEDDRLIATKIKGKYWMYYTHNCLVATSDDLIHWTPLINDDGQVFAALNSDRTGYFDKGSAEAGAIALLTDRGILVMYNGFNLRSEDGGDPEIPYGWFGLGQVLMDAENPTKALERTDKPFIYAEYDWELQGFTPVAVVANGMIHFKGKWLLYYGAADRRIGIAVYKP